MKKHIVSKTIINSILACTILTTGSLTLSVNATSSNRNDAKIDDGLQTLLNTIETNEKISVSVWVNDINHEEVKTEVEKNYKKISQMVKSPKILSSSYSLII